MLLLNIFKLGPLFVQQSPSAQHSHLMVGTGPGFGYHPSMTDPHHCVTEGKAGRKERGGSGRCRGLVNSTQKSHFQLPAQKQPQLAVAQSHFLLSVMTLVLALHLLDRQQQKSVFENEAGIANSSYPSSSPFPPGNRSQQLAGHLHLSWK